MAITWEISVVERTGVLTRPSLAFNSLGEAGIAYYASLFQALRFATLTDTGWAISTVETCRDDCFPSLAFQFPRHPAISYNIAVGAQRFILRYAVYRGGWDTQTVTEKGRSSSLAFDDSARPCISYYDPVEHALKYAAGPAGGGAWIIQTVDEEAGAGSSSCLVFNRSGQPAIAYAATSTDRKTLDAPEIRYAVLKGTTWVREKVFPGAVGAGSAPPHGWGLTGVSLAFSPFSFNGMDPWPIIAFSTSDPSLRPWSMDVVWRNRHTWERFVSLTSYSSPSDGGCLGLNLNFGETALGYHDPYAEAINYIALDSHAPERSIVEKYGKTPEGEFIGPFGLPSLAFKAGDQPAMSYYDAANASIEGASSSMRSGLAP